MTWDEVYELARKLTRVDNAVQYYGLVTDFSAYSLFNQLSAPFIDPATDKGVFTSDERWKTLTNNITRFFQIPGMDLNLGYNWDSPTKRFHQEHTAAMNFYAVPSESSANWGIVTSPMFKEAPGIGIQGNPLAFFPTSMSKHKDIVFDIMTYLTSEEYQLEKSKAGIIPVVTSEKVKAAFAQDVVGLKGKNVKALVPNQSAVPSVKTAQYSLGGGFFVRAATQIVKGEKDLNTALQDADEELNLQINAQLEAQQKK